MADYVADGFALGFWWWLLFARPDGGQTFCDTMRSGNQEVAATAGGVHNLQLEDSGFGLGMLCSIQQYWIESGVE